MKQESVDAARKEFDHAGAELSSMKVAASPQDLDVTWSRFLVRANRVFTKLERGAQEGSCKGWFDRVKHCRRTDPLLKYIHQARDADEHGIERITKQTLAMLKAAVPGETVRVRLTPNPDGSQNLGMCRSSDRLQSQRR